MLDQKKLASVKRQIVMMKKSLDDLLPPGVDTQICFYDNRIRFDVSDWKKGMPIDSNTPRRYYIDVMWRDGEWGFDVSSYVNSGFARDGILLEEKEAGTSA